MYYLGIHAKVIKFWVELLLDGGEECDPGGDTTGFRRIGNILFCHVFYYYI